MQQQIEEAEKWERLLEDYRQLSFSIMKIDYRQMSGRISRQTILILIKEIS